MAEKMRCREVRKLIQTMPKGGCEETMGLISGHLAKCGVCRELLAVSQRVEETFAARKVVLDEIAERHPISEDSILAGIEQPSARRAWRPRIAWAGAAAIVALLFAVAAFHYYLGGNGDRAPVPVSPRISSPPVTRTMAEAAASSILEKLAEVELRYEAPPPRLLSGPPEVFWEPPRSRLLEKCRLASARTLARKAESQTNLTWRNGS